MTTTAETSTPTITEELASKIESAGFEALAATGMTEPILAKKLGVTQEELTAYREYRSVPVDYLVRREWLTEQIRAMAADLNTYFQLSIADIAEKLGTTTITVMSIIDVMGVDTPYIARQKVIKGLQASGYDTETISRVVGVSEKVVEALAVATEEPKRKMKPLTEYAPKRTGANVHTQRIMRFLFENDRPEGWTRSEIIDAVGELGVSPWRRISDVKEKGLAEAVLAEDGTPVTRPGATGHDQGVVRITEAGRIYCKERGYDAE